MNSSTGSPIPNNSKKGFSEEDLTVTLEFKLADIKSNLEKLSQLKAGYIFELPVAIKDIPIQIQANGTHIATGELVAIDDYLGVRLTELI